MADLVDIGGHRFLDELLEHEPKIVHALATAADDNARLSRMQSHLHAVCGALDLDAGDRSVLKLAALVDEFADSLVLDQGGRVSFIQIPFAFPLAVYTDAEANRMYFLTQSYSPFSPGSAAASGCRSDVSSSGASDALTGVA